MKAIILAAGRGTRISRMIQAVPKSTLPIDGVPLIRRSVELLLARGMEVHVCIGYQREKIVGALAGLPVVYCLNPFYDVTNSIASLWLARDAIVGDTLIMNGDVFFEDEILDQLLADKREVVIAMDTGRVEVGDYFFKTVNGYIKRYGKDLPREERTCEYVGIAKITAEFAPIFRRQLDDIVANNGHGHWWEQVLYSMTAQRDIGTIDVKGHFWAEIDYFDDYERILNYVESKHGDKRGD